MRLGSQGHEVFVVQERLLKLGFSPGKPDGDFGPATEAAVLAFQWSEGLLADGIIGPRTAAKLGFDANMRTIGNMPAFAQTYGCKPGDGMVAEDPVSVW